MNEFAKDLMKLYLMYFLLKQDVVVRLRLVSISKQPYV